MVRAILYSLGQQSLVDLEWPDETGIEDFMKFHGYIAGMWYEGEACQIIVGERDEAPKVLISLYLMGGSHDFIIANTALDAAEVMGKVNSFQRLKELEYQPEWARMGK